MRLFWIGLFAGLALLFYAVCASAAEYKAVITSVYDGDTCTADITLGMDVVLKNQKIRIYGIDTPEIRGKGVTEDEKAAGMLSRAYLLRKVDGITVTLVSPPGGDKKGKYGRWLFDIRTPDGMISQLLIDNHLAVRYLINE